MVFGSLSRANEIYGRECRDKFGRSPRRSMCSYFIHIAEDKASDDFGRAAMLRYFHECVRSSLPSDPAKIPPSYAYFLDIAERLNSIRAQDLTSRSILIGSPRKIVQELGEIEASGISEVILYFSYGLKPATMVEEQMRRFAEEIAPHFEMA
jgi:alkanesulfonate monooxygenase SsuD/methylene tetrahydromethanopterin reductase-like flavin-dependent oxidoreductase (luciferase family)